MKQFQYKILSVSEAEKHNETQRGTKGFKVKSWFEYFNIYGQDGWEFCCEITKGNWLFKKEVIILSHPSDGA